ncbi:MAG: hypothetical protein WAK11_13460 [Candidatus Cybelea sp.]
MIPLVLAAVLASGNELQASTLAGVTLGSNLTQVLSEHPGAQRAANPGQRWFWKRRAGGTVTVTADDLGNITRVDFVVSKGQDDSVDLPCVGAFPVRGSHANLEFALDKTACSAFNGATYGLPDRSVVEVRFKGPGYGQLGDGELIEAIWYRRSDLNPSPVGHMGAVLAYLRPVLGHVGGAARIYYAGECEAPEKDTSGVWQLLFPAVYLQPPRPGVTGLSAVRQIFRDDPNVAVVQDRFGILRITIGSPSTRILQTRIQKLTLSPIDRYSAPSAVVAINEAPELHAAERRLDAYSNLGTINIIVSGPIAGAPHLPRLMQKITVDEALDAVVKTFKGIVTYGICKQPDGERLLQFGFAYGS